MKKSFFALTCAVALSCATTMAHAETIRVGTHPTFAPFEFSEQGQVVGFDLDVINAIAKANNDTIELESMPFDGLIPSLLTGNIDLIISGMSITDERKKRVDFTEGYYDSNLSFLINKKDEGKVKTTDDLKGKTLCVQIGTTGHALAQKISPDKVKTFNTEPDALLEMSNGGCDAVINDRPVNLYYLHKAKLSTIVDVVDPAFKNHVDEFGIAVRKGNSELLDKLNDGLKKIEESGELNQIYLKWFGTNIDGSKPQDDDDATDNGAAPMTLEANESHGALIEGDKNSK